MTLAAESELARILAAGKPSGAYFFHGDAARVRDDAARRLIDAALEPSTRDFNYDLFRGDELEPEALAAALAMPPMMAERRVVALFDAQKLPAGARKTVTAALDRLPDDLVFVITATIPKGSRSAFYRTLQGAARAIVWKTPSTSELPGWCIEHARSHHGFELEGKAAQALAAAVGDDLSLLDGELAKLAGVAASSAISAETVRDLVPASRRMDRWSWLDLVAARHYPDALRELPGVLASDRAVSLLSGLIEHHLYLGIAIEEGASGVGRLLKETGRGYLSWKAKSYARQAQRWTSPDIVRALRSMLRADLRLKSGGGERAVLEELLLDLRHGEAAPRGGDGAP